MRVLKFFDQGNHLVVLSGSADGEPYNVNGPTQEELLRRIASTDIAPEVGEIVGERMRLASALSAMPKVRKVHHSDANFLLVEVSDADAMYDYLIGHGVIVRNRNRVDGCKGCLRFTVGTPAAMSVEAIRRNSSS